MTDHAETDRTDRSATPRHRAPEAGPREARLGEPQPGTPQPGEAQPAGSQPSAAESAGSGAQPREREFPTVLEQVGGIAGIVASSIPVAVFIVVNIIGGLKPALIASIAVAVAVAIWRVARKQAIQPAVSGLIGVAVAGFIAYRTGDARTFYLPGLLLSAVLCLAFLVSLVVRWPLAGVVWHGINGDGMGWRADPRMRRAYMIATGMWTLVFAARLVVQGWLYNVDQTTWLGIARLAMGYPLFGLALLGTIFAVRRAQAVAANTT